MEVIDRADVCQGATKTRTLLGVQTELAVLVGVLELVAGARAGGALAVSALADPQRSALCRGLAESPGVERALRIGAPVFFRKEYRTEPRRLADHLLWSKLVYGPEQPPAPGQVPSTPTVMQNKDGSFMAILRYRGPDVTMLDYAQWCVYLEGWNRLLKRLGGGWALWADEWHEPSTAYPQSAWSNPAAYFVDTVRKTLFESGQLFETQHYLTLTWQPPSARQRYWLDTLFVQRAAQRGRQEDAAHLAQVVRALEKVADALHPLMPACGWCTPKETLTYLHRCVSWDRHPVALPAIPDDLDMRLATTRFTHGNTPRLGGRLLRPIGVRHWPEGLGVTIPATLQHLPFSYRFTVRYICLDTAKAKRVLNGMRRRWEVQVLPVWTHVMDAWNGTKTDWQDPTATVHEEAREHAYALQRAVSSLAQGDIAYGYCTPTLLVWSDTVVTEDPATEQQARAELAAKEREVLKLLQGEELILEPETVNASRAWLAMQPGDAYNNVRNPPLSTWAFAFLLPHGATWAGPTWDYHFQGPPLFMTASNGQPFQYVLHQGEVGHTMIVGPTRSGKSALLGLMAMQDPQARTVQGHLQGSKILTVHVTPVAGGSRIDASCQLAMAWMSSLFPACDTSAVMRALQASH
jgi:type IV secretion system protein VirB4